MAITPLLNQLLFLYTVKSLLVTFLEYKTNSRIQLYNFKSIGNSIIKILDAELYLLLRIIPNNKLYYLDNKNSYTTIPHYCYFATTDNP